MNKLSTRTITKKIIELALTAVLLAGAGVGTFFAWQSANHLHQLLETKKHYADIADE